MISDSPETEPASDLLENLESRLERLEQEYQEARRQSEQRLMMAETKAEAIATGIVDLDGLQFLDMSLISMDEDGRVVGSAEAIRQLRRAKPWLFSSPSSSSTAKVPPSKLVRKKHVTEMTDAEYKIARENLLRQSS